MRSGQDNVEGTVSIGQGDRQTGREGDSHTELGGKSGEGTHTDIYSYRQKYR